MFREIGKCDISFVFFLKKRKRSKSVLEIFFQNFGRGRDSPLWINCASFIVGCKVGLRAFLDQKQYCTTLGENKIAYALVHLFLSHFFCHRFKHMSESVFKFSLVYQVGLTRLKCWNLFSFLFRTASAIFDCALLSLLKIMVSLLKSEKIRSGEELGQITADLGLRL